MKSITIWIVSFFALILAGCQNAAEKEDMIYFSGTERNPAMSITVEGPASYGLSVTSSCKVEKDMKVKLRLAPELLELYNTKVGKTYELLPDNSYNLDNDELIIEKGNHVSAKTLFNINKLDDFVDGKVYCMPIQIVGVDGGMSVLESSRVAYIVVNRTIITNAIDLRGSCAFKVEQFQGNEKLKSLPAVSMEARVNVTGFMERSPFISTIMGIEENFLLRFGDVTIDKSQLQLAGGGRQVTAPLKFATNTWYHVAVVYNGSSVKLYINGELSASKDGLSGAIDLTGGSQGFYIGQSCGSRKLNGKISECRVWTKALSDIDIQNNMCAVDVESPDLLAYWKMNEGTGNTVKDWSGNGYDLTPLGGTITWIEGVKCPE